MANLDIYYDSLTEATWFSSLNPEFDLLENNYKIIERRGYNPPIIDEITSYDKPDIIVLKDNKPILVIEMTQEVPTGHNVGQRFARLVKSIEMNVPAIYFFPFDAMKHGTNSNICNLNIRLLAAAEKMLRLHHTPLLCVNWITDCNGEIITDGSENIRIKELLASYVNSGYHKFCTEFTNELNNMRYEYNIRLQNRPSYATLPPSVILENTSDIIAKCHIIDAKTSFIQRLKTYVYKMAMTPEKCKRQDPYTGTAFIYDYLVCRIGVDVSEKESNLALWFPNITKETWFKNNPNNPMTKSCNWYLTANLLIFKDGYYIVRN